MSVGIYLVFCDIQMKSIGVSFNAY